MACVTGGVSSKTGKKDTSRKECRMKQKKRSDLERGASLIEYGLLVVLLTVIGIASERLVGQAVSSKYKQIAKTITADGDTSANDKDSQDRDDTVDVDPACTRGPGCQRR